VFLISQQMRHIVLLFIIAVHAINRVIHIISRNDFGADTLGGYELGLTKPAKEWEKNPFPFWSDVPALRPPGFDRLYHLFCDAFGGL
jgi:hypothetical protein